MQKNRRDLCHAGFAVNLLRFPARLRPGKQTRCQDQGSLPYSAALTGSHHSLRVSVPGTSTAR